MQLKNEMRKVKNNIEKLPASVTGEFEHLAE